MYIAIMKKELLKGTLKTIVLHLLEKEGRMYGYEISQKVKELSAEKILLTEGALYPTLHKLEAEGWLTAEKEYQGKRIRKYYSLSKTGKSAASQKMEEFKEFMDTMKLVLNLEPSTKA